MNMLDQEPLHLHAQRTLCLRELYRGGLKFRRDVKGVRGEGDMAGSGIFFLFQAGRWKC